MYIYELGHTVISSLSVCQWGEWSTEKKILGEGRFGRLSEGRAIQAKKNKGPGAGVCCADLRKSTEISVAGTRLSEGDYKEVAR